MASLNSSISSHLSLAPGAALTLRKTSFPPRCSKPRNLHKPAFPPQKHLQPLSTSIRLIPQFLSEGILKPRPMTHLLPTASGSQAAVEVKEEEEASADSSSADNATPKSSPPTKSKRLRPGRKSEMPPVENEQLIPGAAFKGKVRSIQPFGAFVDFGAFTDGLVHVSRLSDGFVKDVANVVTVGQEVTVRLIEANMETGRIALTMRDSDDPTKTQQLDKQRDSNSEKSRGPSKFGQKRDERKSSKFVKGQNVEGTVKNLTRAGAFISLPEGEEGFLPTSEEADEGFVNMMGGSSLEVGQEVSVRVLRVSRGQVTLTMKKEEDAEELDERLSQGVVHSATNPFVLAFRGRRDISAFLEEREKADELAEVAKVVAGEDTTDDDKEEGVENKEGGKISGEVALSGEEASNLMVKEEEQSKEEDNVGFLAVQESESELSVELPSTDNAAEKAVQESESELSVEPPSTDNAAEKAVQESESELSVEPPYTDNAAEKAVQESESELSVEPPSTDNAAEKAVQESESELSVEPPSTDNAAEKDWEPLISGESNEVVKNVNEEASESILDKDENQSEGVEENAVANSDENGIVESSRVEIISEDLEAESTDNVVSEGDVALPVVEAQTTVDPEQNRTISSPSVPNSDASPKETTTKAAISPGLVKQLREETGAGMMDCKKALSETGGDIVKAQEYLRKKGLASADKKASRATAEGRIGSYIHDSRIGVLIEVNCETDFVARDNIFKDLVEDLAMQVAACPQVQYLDTEDVPKEIVDKEREIEMQKEDLLSKPEAIRSKIVDGRIKKRLDELALLEQPFIKDDKVVVKDWVKQTISTIGENIKVKRFVRYNLGEGLEKNSQDFAAEVAAQTASKSVSTPVKQEEPSAAVSAEAETKETVEEPPKVAVSAALVKQLREESGAGMMDCKKALSETGGDLSKAQAYLRKKGLSTADKKSGRAAAEGRVGSYIHDSRIGVLIEVNCETDFVGRSQNFKELVDDLAMQAVACPNVQYVSIEDIPKSIIDREKELEMQREDLKSRPENVREKIVEGRIAKRLGELALLEQPFIKNDGLLVKDLVKQTVAALGENVKVRRFVRFTLGEN